MQFKLDGQAISDRQDLYDQISEQLPVPEYFGNNLDALHDILTEIPGPHSITIQNFHALVHAVGGHYIVRMLCMLTDSGCQVHIQ